VENEDVFARATEKALPFEPVDHFVAGQHVDAEKPLHLRLRQLQARHLAILGLHKLDVSVDARLYRHHGLPLQQSVCRTNWLFSLEKPKPVSIRLLDFLSPLGNFPKGRDAR